MTATAAATHLRRRLHARHVLLALASCGALAIVWTWPLASRLTSRVPNDPGDPILNVWILWWNAQALPLTGRWWSPPIFVPFTGSLALSEHLLGLSVFATPLQLAGTSAVTAYNLLFVLSYALSAFFAYLVGFRLTGSKLAAAGAGAAFGFSPYRAAHLGHIQVLTSQWMPLMLLGMHAYVETGRRSWLVVFGSAWLLQSLSNAYYMLFVPVLIVPWIVWFTPWRTAPGRALALTAAWGLASIPLLPVALGYYRVHSSLGIVRSLEVIRRFSATPESFVNPPPGLLVWFDGRGPTPEGFLFPGAALVIVVIGGMIALLFSRTRGSAGTAAGAGAVPLAAAGRPDLGRAIAFYAAMAMAMYVFAFGPGGEPDGPPSMLRPYSWLLSLPGYEGLRVPARFAMPGTLCLAIAAACTIGLLVRVAGRLARVAGGAALVGLALDGLTRPVTLVPLPQRLALPQVGAAQVVEIPADEVLVNAAAMYRSIFHRLPLINGYSGHIPYHAAILSRWLRYRDPTILQYLARDGPLVVVVNRSADRRGSVQRWIARLPGATLLQITGAGQVFLLPRQPWTAPAIGDTRVRATAQRTSPAHLELDLGSAQRVRGVEFAMRARYRELPRRMLIEASDDGEHWREVWVGWTGALAMDAVLRDPHSARVRMGFPEVRMRHVRVSPAPEWLGEEMTIAVARAP